MVENIEIKIDYFSTTFPLDVDADDSVLFKVNEMVMLIAQYLNVENFEIVKCKYAQNNYNYQYILGENIILRLDGPMNDCYQRTCHFEMKGEGCREFEVRNKDKTWINLILFMVELNARFKRIDIAIDDYEGKHVTLPWILNKINKKHYTSVFRSNPQPHGTLESGLSIQFGTNESPIQLVIYDKLAERKKRRVVIDKEYWVRYELRFRAETAEKLVFKLISTFEDPNEEMYGTKLQKLAFEQLYRVLDIKKENGYSEKAQHKVDTDSKWKSFLDDVEKGSLSNTDELPPTFDAYLKSAMPYVVTYLIVKYFTVHRDPYLLEIEMFKLLRDNLAFSKQRFQRLNIYLNQLRLQTIDDATLAELKLEFAGIVNDKEVPF